MLQTIILALVTLLLLEKNVVLPVTAFSAEGNKGNNGVTPDGSTAKKYRPDYVSRSTATPDASALFADGSELRKDRLEKALMGLGVDPVTLTESDEFRGSAALRAYSSFVIPKSQGALAIAESPQRASVIANNIAFYVREQKSHEEDWLRNHDRSLQEVLGARQPLTLVLDNVRSAHNVGNILRAAEAARIAEVILCGITPGPPNPKVLKTALGAAEYVPYAHFGSTLEAVQNLKSHGYTVLGVETTSKSKPMWKIDMPQPLALVFGNEIVGVHADVLAACDDLVCIPTHGIKNSLNVATCASILLWEALRKWDELDGES
eukprot:scaffold57045_cov52-Attheya_sp.AAC.1